MDSHHDQLDPTPPDGNKGRPTGDNAPEPVKSEDSTLQTLGKATAVGGATLLMLFGLPRMSCMRTRGASRSARIKWNDRQKAIRQASRGESVTEAIPTKTEDKWREKQSTE